ncbi:MAG: hypothetical protein ACU83N_14100 [Gammaproteobacteria bacterium]
MNIVKNTALILMLAFSLGSISLVTQAKETAKGSVYSPNAAIMHIEKAKVELMQKDFVPPSAHIKAARTESKKVTGNPDIVKKAAASLIEAQVKVQEGDLKGATDELNKALELYKSL